MNTAFRILTLSLIVCLSPIACSTEQGDDERILEARAQTEAFMDILRAKQWDKASELVLVNDRARNRFSLPKDADRSEVMQHAAELFKAVYQHQGPGPIESARIERSETDDTERLIIQYRHGDLDGFLMRQVDGRWLYSFE